MRGSREAMSLLERLRDSEREERFVHAVADGLCGRASPRYGDYGHTWSPGEWLCVLRETRAALLEAVRDASGETQDGAAVRAVEACVAVRRDELRAAATRNALAMGSTQLRDFDWKLKLALSSDRHSALQTPLLVLPLDVRRVDAAPHDLLDALTLELSATELATLIAALESASKVVQQLK